MGLINQAPTEYGLWGGKWGLAPFSTKISPINQAPTEYGLYPLRFLFISRKMGPGPIFYKSSLFIGLVEIFPVFLLCLKNWNQLSEGNG